ncbi:Hypothetical protein BN85401390 [Alteracholeplasma palmae J233]|uniref:Uncharacterized protein n=1 Tax=Alteracholeplasma palmae (strain ATCC 49389 / J233) TaxID=1318466 RepID=U4KQY8_ALTPJ|nr:hypothetical protein [Alteracholeplasma palmae]CCV63716.1 Hypothetical protein BN85401390 [Alteracholeplasma palmae J233]
MARVNTNTKKNKKSSNNKKEVRRSNVVTQEESPKGEAFFKIVLWLMFAAFLAAATWLIVQTIINNNDKETKPFESEMYVTLDEVKALDASENFKETTNENLKKAFSTTKLDVYVYFYNSSLTDGKEVYQTEDSKLIKELWENAKKETYKNEADEEVNFYSFEGNFTVFFFDFANQDYTLKNFTNTGTSEAFPYLGKISAVEDTREVAKGKNVSAQLKDLIQKSKSK